MQVAGRALRTTPFQVTVDADKNDWLFELDKN
jgi:hypothetical protein